VTEADATTDALLRDWSRWCNALSDRAIVKPMKAVSLFATGAHAPPLNCVFTARSDVEPKPVEELLNMVKGLGLPHCLQIRPGCGPELATLARSRGMHLESPVPLMRRESSGPDLATIAAHPSLVIRELTEDESQLHVSIASSGFEAPPALFEAVVTPAILALPGFHCYVGSVDRQPVTTAVGIVEEDHVGIYNVATLQAHRGRGYAAAITARAVLDGYAATASFAFLQSSDSGFRVYERLGFRTLENWAVWVAA